MWVKGQNAKKKLRFEKYKAWALSFSDSHFSSRDHYFGRNCSKVIIELSLLITSQASRTYRPIQYPSSLPAQSFCYVNPAVPSEIAEILLHECPEDIPSYVELDDLLSSMYFCSLHLSSFHGPCISNLTGNFQPSYRGTKNNATSTLFIDPVCSPQKLYHCRTINRICVFSVSILHELY